jgi:hypothetical protein
MTKADKQRERERERERKSLLDSIAKNTYSNFSYIHSYLLNEKKKRIRRKTREISSITHVIRLPLTRTSRLSFPNELSSTTSFRNIKKKKNPRTMNTFTKKKKTNPLIIANMTIMHTFDISLQLSCTS